MGIVPQGIKLGSHSTPRKIHCLNLQSMPTDATAGGLGNDQVDLSGWFVRFGSLHEWNLTGN